jgi:2-keto-4-pentenoate hydratase/2-oxohepta-3-ene-1,7-dioic acid hydratase in catechol pathway
VVGPDANVVHPAISHDVQHEAELAAVIGKVARHVKAEDASAFILGYTAANDVTARDLQARDGQWARAKGFDTFCPLGPAIETELDPLEKLAVICRVNGDVRQAGFTSDMVFGVAEIIEHVTAVMTLLPGDVILTGTPSGVGKVEVGDVMEVEVDGIGTLRNPVVMR